MTVVAQVSQLHAGGWAGDEEAARPDPGTMVTATEDGRVLVAARPTPPPRRMPIKTATVDLGGEYAGWTATVRTNAPFSNFLALTRLSEGDGTAGIQALAEVYALLPKLVMGWNFVDEEGESLPCNVAGFARLPAEMIVALIGALNSAGADDPKG